MAGVADIEAAPAELGSFPVLLSTETFNTNATTVVSRLLEWDCSTDSQPLAVDPFQYQGSFQFELGPEAAVFVTIGVQGMICTAHG